MRILTLLQTQDQTDDQLLAAYRKSYDPDDDGVRRFREAVYEMLQEETIRFQKENGTYRARWRHAKTQA